LDDKKLDDKKLDNKKLERVDIIFDYGSLTIECQPRVTIYSITVEGSDLTIKQRFNPNIRKFMNLAVETFEQRLEDNGTACSIEACGLEGSLEGKPKKKRFCFVIRVWLVDSLQGKSR